MFNRKQRLINSLCRAAKKGNLKKVKELLAEGADPAGISGGGFSLNYHKITALHYAAIYNWPEVVKAILEAHPKIVDAPLESLNLTPLMIAIRDREHTEAISVLIDKGANINAQDPLGSPLHYAAREGRLAAVKLLLEKGADVNAVDLNGCKASVIAATHGHKGIFDILRAHEEALIKPQPTTDGWALSSPDEIVFIEVKAAAGYKLTSIFNFADEKYLHISRNLETNAESQSVKLFREFTDPQLIDKARDQLIRLGGKPPERSASCLILKKSSV